MTGSKRKIETLDELLKRQWCYYRERDFDDQQVPQTHQREMHFHCDNCNRRLNTANVLAVHTQQVHKAQITQIRDAIDGRESSSMEIFGTVGIPADLAETHRQSIYIRRHHSSASFTFTIIPIGVLNHSEATTTHKHQRSEPASVVDISYHHSGLRWSRKLSRPTSRICDFTLDCNV